MPVAQHFGLVGGQISYSFSPGYFREKFARLGLATHRYDLFEVREAAAIPALFRADAALRGLNVTIPYKQAVLPFLTELDPAARALGAVNVIKRLPGGSLRGYNTDAPAFRDTLRAWYRGPRGPALVLGTGGAACAVQWGLQQLGLASENVSRTGNTLTYASLQANPALLAGFALLINATPVGTFPALAAMPPLPLAGLGAAHWVYDLIYNPAETRLLAEARTRGAQTHNGLPMLHRQADLAWELWQTPEA